MVSRQEFRQRQKEQVQRKVNSYTLLTPVHYSVDLGYDPLTNEYVAIKTIRMGFIPLIKCLKNEFELAKGLDHPNIIKYKEFFEKTDFIDKESSKYKVAALVMEAADNGELFQYVIACGGLSEPIARFYFKQILNGNYSRLFEEIYTKYLQDWITFIKRD